MMHDAPASPMKDPSVAIPAEPIVAPTQPASPQEKGLRYLEGWDLVKSIVGLNLANSVSFVDLVGITAIVSVIGDDLNAGNTIAWAATSQLIGATIGQAILGYLSDVWSRRRMLQIALGMLIFSSLGCGFSRYALSAPMFFAFRSISGIACGSISNLVNIAQNDFLPSHRRLKWQGVQSSSIALGSIVGITAGAGFATIGRWEVLYYMEAAMSAAALAGVFWCVPANSPPPRRHEIMDALKTIDYWGILTGTGAVVPALCLICEGTSLPTPVLIALGVLTGVFGILFLWLGFKSERTVRPIVPFFLFKNRTLAAIYMQNILFGGAYYSFTYFLPLSFQVVAGWSLIKSAVSMIPYFVTHGTWGIFSALIVRDLQKRGHRSFSYMFYFGFGVWMIADGLIAWNFTASVPGLVYFLEVLVGFGTGSTFTNSVLAIRAQVTAEHNAVAVGTRNVLRFFGGALGTAISSVILSTQFSAALPSRLQYLAQEASEPNTAGLSAGDESIVHDAYTKAVGWVFYISLAFLGGCFLLNLLIKDNKQKKPAPRDVENSNIATPTNTQEEVTDEKDASLVHYKSGTGSTGDDNKESDDGASQRSD